jgi:hypothetical protein
MIKVTRFEIRCQDRGKRKNTLKSLPASLFQREGLIEIRGEKRNWNLGIMGLNN